MASDNFCAQSRHVRFKFADIEISNAFFFKVVSIHYLGGPKGDNLLRVA